MIILCQTSLSGQLVHLLSGNTESKGDSKSLFLNFHLLMLLVNRISKIAFSFRKRKQVWCNSKFLLQTHHHLSKWGETDLNLIYHLSFSRLFLVLKWWGNFLSEKWVFMEHSPSLYPWWLSCLLQQKSHSLKTSELILSSFKNLCSFLSTFMKKHKMEWGLEGKWKNKQEEKGWWIQWVLGMLLFQETSIHTFQPSMC